MILTNYHSHTILSDGAHNSEEMIKSAIEKELKAFGFSEHSPLPFFSQWSMKYEDLHKYFREINYLKEKYSEKIEIYTGLEVDYIEKITGIETWKNFRLDYTIGSVHFLGVVDNKPFTIDYSPANFKEGLDKIFSGNIMEMTSLYYNQIIKMINSSKPDIIGHFDLITKFNKETQLINENDKWYKDIVIQTLEIIKKNNCFIEINTRGFYKKLADWFYPNTWILKECKNFNIPIVINSDCHKNSEVDKNLYEAEKIALSLGFKEKMVLLNNQWQEIGLS